MRSGSLKKKIVIQNYNETPNDYGEIVKGWVDFKPTYASIVPQSGVEYFKDGVQAKVTHKISFRYMAGVLPSMRIVYGTRVFNIHAVLNIREENKTLQAMAMEVIS